VAAAALLLAVPGAGAQEPDSIPGDSTATPRYAIPGLTVSVARAVSTSGGTSAVELSLDSAAVAPAPTLEGILRDMPLVVVRQNSRGQAQPALRGADDRQIAVLTDGVPLTLGWDHRTDLSIVPMTAARNIRLIRGLSSVLHGPNVLGGVVEIDVARGAAEMPDPDPLTADLAADHLGGRSLGVSGGKRLEIGGGSWVIRAGAGYHERPGVSVPGALDESGDLRLAALTEDGDLRLNSDAERYDGFLSVRHRSESGAWASFSGSAFVSESGVPHEAHVDDPRLWRYDQQDRFIAALTGGTGQRETAWGTGDVEASIGIDVGRTFIDEYRTLSFRDVSGGEVGDDRTLTVRFLADHSLGESGQLRTAVTYADVVHDEVLDGREFNEYRQRLWSAGAETEWNLEGLVSLPGLHGTKLSAGVALDGADTPRSGNKPALGTLWEWGGRVGFSALSRNDRFLFHGGLSRRSRFPALRELYSGALGRFVPNPDLEQEILTAVEGGFTVRDGGNELQAVVFHQRLSDGIVRSSVTSEEGERKFKRVNQKQVRSTGLEILASGSLGPFSVSGDLTLQDVKGLEEDGSEVELEYEPDVSGKLAVGLDLPWEVLGSADLRFMGDQFCQNPEVGGLQGFETNPSLDAGLRRAFRTSGRRALTRWEAFLSVNNVTDAAVYDQCGLPQPGRTVQLQIRLR
jgi:iron complex outermembrane receptor protein